MLWWVNFGNSVSYFTFFDYKCMAGKSLNHAEPCEHQNPLVYSNNNS